ncbi:MAG: helix-turn-helix domain-containing protein [SAR324 cluster bacterium]|nr:helix-turn-helix domain-containing protein [SAR324 cluster bacterium]
MKPISNSSLEQKSENLLTVKEAATLLRVKPQSIHNALSNGRYGLDRVKLFGRTYVKRQQVESILDSALMGGI